MNLKLQSHVSDSLGVRNPQPETPSGMGSLTYGITVLSLAVASATLGRETELSFMENASAL
ncbi:MAG TPA: hypothetical protein VN749_19800 [Candidatus Eisenbacteria bacterium]|jgi:hypothetical protein|nr:hypothetical protein [Candidatus Eisenbacteria bacterium]